VNEHCDADVKPDSDSNAVDTSSMPDPASLLKVSTKTLNDSEVGTKAIEADNKNSVVFERSKSSSTTEEATVSEPAVADVSVVEESRVSTVDDDVVSPSSILPSNELDSKDIDDMATITASLPPNLSSSKTTIRKTTKIGTAVVEIKTASTLTEVTASTNNTKLSSLDGISTTRKISHKSSDTTTTAKDSSPEVNPLESEQLTPQHDPSNNTNEKSSTVSSSTALSALSPLLNSHHHNTRTRRSSRKQNQEDNGDGSTIPSEDEKASKKKLKNMESLSANDCSKITGKVKLPSKKDPQCLSSYSKKNDSKSNENASSSLVLSSPVSTSVNTAVEPVTDTRKECCLKDEEVTEKIAPNENEADHQVSNCSYSNLKDNRSKGHIANFAAVAAVNTSTKVGAKSPKQGKEEKLVSTATMATITTRAKSHSESLLVQEKSVDSSPLTRKKSLEQKKQEQQSSTIISSKKSTSNSRSGRNICTPPKRQHDQQQISSSQRRKISGGSGSTHHASHNTPTGARISRSGRTVKVPQFHDEIEQGDQLKRSNRNYYSSNKSSNNNNSNISKYSSTKKGFDGDEDSMVSKKKKKKKEYENDEDVKESSSNKKSSLPLSSSKNDGSDEQQQFSSGKDKKEQLPSGKDKKDKEEQLSGGKDKNDRKEQQQLSSAKDKKDRKEQQQLSIEKQNTADSNCKDKKKVTSSNDITNSSKVATVKVKTCVQVKDKKDSLLDKAKHTVIEKGKKKNNAAAMSAVAGNPSQCSARDGDDLHDDESKKESKKIPASLTISSMPLSSSLSLSISVANESESDINHVTKIEAVNPKLDNIDEALSATTGQGGIADSEKKCNSSSYTIAEAVPHTAKRLSKQPPTQQQQHQEKHDVSVVNPTNIAQSKVTTPTIARIVVKKIATMKQKEEHIIMIDNSNDKNKIVEEDDVIDLAADDVEKDEAKHVLSKEKLSTPESIRVINSSNQSKTIISKQYEGNSVTGVKTNKEKCSISTSTKLKKEANTLDQNNADFSVGATIPLNSSLGSSNATTTSGIAVSATNKKNQFACLGSDTLVTDKCIQNNSSAAGVKPAESSAKGEVTMDVDCNIVYVGSNSRHIPAPTAVATTSVSLVKYSAPQSKLIAESAGGVAAIAAAEGKAAPVDNEDKNLKAPQVTAKDISSSLPTTKAVAATIVTENAVTSSTASDASTAASGCLQGNNIASKAVAVTPSSAIPSNPLKVPRRKPGARECMQISRRFGVQVIPDKYMETLLDYCTRGKVEHLIRMRERLDEHYRMLEGQLAGLEDMVKITGESDIVAPPEETDDGSHPTTAVGGS